MKAAVLLPAATVTVAGTAAAALLLLSDTVDPPAGAAVHSALPCRSNYHLPLRSSGLG